MSAMRSNQQKINDLLSKAGAKPGTADQLQKVASLNPKVAEALRHLTDSDIAKINAILSDKDAANNVATLAPGLEGVDDVVYYRDTIEKLAQISHFIEIGSIVAMAFLVIVSVVIVANTIKLTVFNREKEISIMKYLGATNWFVKAPFIWGGIIIGILSSVIATGLTYVIYRKIVGIIGSDILRILSVNLVPAEQLTMTLLVSFLCLGIGIGVIGSAISIRKFLNV